MVEKYVPKKMSGQGAFKGIIEMHKSEMFLSLNNFVDEMNELELSKSLTNKRSDVFIYRKRAPFVWPPTMNQETNFEMSSDTDNITDNNNVVSQKKIPKNIRFSDIQRVHYKKGDGSKRKGRPGSKANYKRTCYEPHKYDD